NNPTLYAIVDATESLGFARGRTRGEHRRGRVPAADAARLEPAEVGEQATVDSIPPKDDGDKHTVDGPTAQGAVARGRDRPHPRQVHAAGNGNGHARGRPKEARLALAAWARLRPRRRS